MDSLPIFVDTDVGLGTPGAEIDDGAALIVLLRAAGLDVRGVGTVHGNVPVDHATHNARRLLSHLGRPDIPVGRGAALPLIEDPAWFAAWQAGYGPTPPFHGSPSLPGHDDLPAAAALLIDLVRAAPGEVTVLALGPLTNLALAARLAPDVIGSVREVIAMGGSFGSASRAPEFNARCDPEAARIVLTARWRRLRLLGLDITRQVVFSRDDLARLPDRNPAVSLLRAQAPGWIDRVEAQGWERGGCALHDAVAVAALIDETLCRMVEAVVEVELADPAARGITRCIPAAGEQAQVAVGIDAGRCKALIESHLAQ